MKTKSINFSFLLKLLFIPILYELVIGGSGHYSEIGPITLRMLLYIIAIFVSFIYYSNKKVIKKDVIIIVLSFTFTSLLSSIIGYFNDASVGAILEDLKPLTFFYMLLFFSLVINNVEDIKKIKVIIKIGSFSLAIIYFLVIILLLLGKINFVSFYQQQNEIGEIMFRSNFLFFYKGFLYLCIGFFFFLLSKGKYNKLGALILFVSIVLTLTRGFIFFTFLIFIYYIFFINRNVVFKWGVFLCGTLLSIAVVPLISEGLGDKSGSDSMRYLQIDEVIYDINPLSFIIGHGLGVGVESRPVHMELSFLEIFHKQGVIGLSFWIGLFIHIFLMYLNIRNKEYKVLALPFLLSVIFIILQSGTNPYMNNPIGLTMILITIVVFSKLLELQKNTIK